VVSANPPLSPCWPPAWRQDPLTALKLVYNLWGIHNTCKNDEESYYNCSLWIHDHHPRSLALNVTAELRLVGPLGLGRGMSVGAVEEVIEDLKKVLHVAELGEICLKVLLLRNEKGKSAN